MSRKTSVAFWVCVWRFGWHVWRFDGQTPHSRPNATQMPHPAVATAPEGSTAAATTAHSWNPPCQGAADGLWAGVWILSGAVVDAADASGV